MYVCSIQKYKAKIVQSRFRLCIRIPRDSTWLAGWAGKTSFFSSPKKNWSKHRPASGTIFSDQIPADNCTRPHEKKKCSFSSFTVVSSSSFLYSSLLFLSFLPSLLPFPSLHILDNLTMDILQCYNDSRHLVDWTDIRMKLAIASIMFNPTFWNIVARRGELFIHCSLRRVHDNTIALGSHGGFRNTRWRKTEFTFFFFSVYSPPMTLFLLFLTFYVEYRTKFITKIFGGNELFGCYALAITIFIIGIVRDGVYVSISNVLCLSLLCFFNWIRMEGWLCWITKMECDVIWSAGSSVDCFPARE